jgi:hypothetical protein
MNVGPKSRRRALSMGIGLAAASGMASSQPADAESKKASFVLVHGAWHGGWCWRRVYDRLTAKGHCVVAPTLSGVGERSHLKADDIDLATQIQDVVGEIFDQALEHCRADRSWQTTTVTCGHDVMIDQPDVLSAVLEKVV